MSNLSRTACPRARISFTQFTNTYAPFAILVCLALIAPEATQNLERYRTIFTIWATIILLTPALCCFVFSDITRAAYNYWHLLWTFSFLAYMLHFYWAVFIVFQGIRGTFVGQGNLIAGTNFLLTAWWGIDVVLSWLLTSYDRWLRVERLGAHVFVFTVFAITTLLLRPTPVTKALGMILVIGVAVSLAIRLAWGKRLRFRERQL
jgi:hypothetical protein